nr:MAG TPA: protein of unknown function DUF285 [Caudoviricetes sp.]
MGGGVTFSVSPAKKKGQIFVAKGSAPWYNTEETWFDVDRVTNVDESIPGQATVTCKNVTNMGDMFNGCSELTSIDLSNFDTSKVKNMNWLFYDCISLVSADLSNLNTSNVIKMNGMFYSCRNLTLLDISNFNTSKVTDMAYMFNYCRSLASIDVSSFNTSNVTNMYAMFEYCSNLTSLDLSNFDTSNVTDMGYMFRYCSSLTSIKGMIDMKHCESYVDMFYDCPKLRDVKIKNPPSGFDGAGLSSSQYTIVS